ncbi:hypothetical protein AB0I22_20500 [Streptomyces sp. NPDC050610]|uniref:hypothetical protein n=1 Tax=Streptomyces sp. NPDC050610 TaxID=3157097 RepID=UPI00343EC4B3
MHQPNHSSARRRTIPRPALLTDVTAMTVPHLIGCSPANDQQARGCDVYRIEAIDPYPTSCDATVERNVRDAEHAHQARQAERIGAFGCFVEDAVLSQVTLRQQVGERSSQGADTDGRPDHHGGQVRAADVTQGLAAR